MTRHRRPISLMALGGVLLVTLGPAALATPPAPVAAAQGQDSLPNPEVPEQCGLPMTLVLDASGSILTFDAVEQVRDAAEVFLDAVKDTGSTVRVVDFGTVARQTAPADLVTTPSMQPGGVHGDAIEGYYNPRPTIDPPNTYRYDGSGSITSESNFTLDFEDQWTNWEDALRTAGEVRSDLVVFITDGDPTALSSSQPGDPFFDASQDPPNARFNLSSTNSMSRSINAANALKQASVDTRIVAVGVGAAVTQPQSVARLTQISGPQVVDETSIGTVTSINQIDVAVVEDFDNLAALLRKLVTELCSPSLTVRKFTQSAGSATYEPAEGWDITVEPTILGDPPGTYRWIQPADTPVGPATRTTNELGFAQFQWEPSPPDRASTVAVSEDLAAHPDYVTGPALCEVVEPDGDVFFYPRISASFNLDVGPEDIVTCALQNNFVYVPVIELEKVASEEVVRGDGGGTEVTYEYTVTNSGNTPLVLTAGGDPNCAEIEFIGGDANDDGRLDLTETWTFECTKTLVAGVTQDEIVVPNEATVTGVAPNGDSDTDTANETVQVIVPFINLEKEADQTLVTPGTEVNYTFTVTNLGNDPLSDISVVDDQCGEATFVDGDDNGDGILDLDEEWTFTCSVVIGIEDPTINQALATGTPSVGGDVTDPADADIDLIFPSLLLNKIPSAIVVFEGDEVTYTYEVTNPGEEPLTPGPGLTREDMLVDDSCTDVTFVSGDAGDDSILQPGGVETWIYECATTPEVSTVNLATVTMQGEVTGTITRNDDEFVIVVPTGIEIIKTASDDLVPAGTDVTYTYEVTNPGGAPLADVSVEDDFCSPVEFVEGDTDGDGQLDPGELFIFTCTASLTEDTTNTAIVTGTPVIGPVTGDPVTADDPATIDVYTSSIELDKTASEASVPLGTPVTFTFVATNTGDISIVPIGIVDDQCNPLEFIGGDPEDDGRMAPGEAWTWECTKEMNATTTNTATIEAVDPGGEVVTDDDDDEVVVFNSDINLEKTADPILVPAGEETTFTLTVTNPGPVPLSDITLTDDTCSDIQFVGGDSNGDQQLDPDETWTYTCSAPINEVTVNVAEAEGTDPGGGQPTDTGVAGAIPYNPGIDVVKTANPFQVLPGGTVTYTYAVSNTGDVPLADVAENITDDKCSPVTYVSGDLNENGLLDADVSAPMFEYISEAETWIFTCSTTLTEDTTNVVTVEGTPSLPDGTPIGDPVSDEDEETVDVITELPATGAAAPFLVALTLLLGGGLVVWTARRRRPRSG